MKEACAQLDLQVQKKEKFMQNQARTTCEDEQKREIERDGGRGGRV